MTEKSVSREDNKPSLRLDSNLPWSFDGRDTVQKFDEHVEKSVRLYRESHELTLDLLPFFLSSGPARVLDVGSSTGTFLAQLKKRYSHLDLELFGIDRSDQMTGRRSKKMGR